MPSRSRTSVLRVVPLVPLLALVLLALLATGLYAGAGAPRVRPAAATAPTSTATACDGVDYLQVYGPRPRYGQRDLRDYPARAQTCRAFWLPSADQSFVPQAVAIDGTTAWVSGYTWVKDVAAQACRLVRIDTRTGKVLFNQSRINGRIPGSAATYCRHGGGLALGAGNRLWISEKDRLWLVDAKTHRTLRLWRIHRPVFGSSVVLHDGLVGLLEFRRGGTKGTISWLSEASLLKAGVTDIWRTGPSRTRAVPSSVRQVPAYAQGGSWWKNQGLITTRSWDGCGQMVLPTGTRFGVLRGIQDVELAPGSRVWVVSEASAKPYQGANGKMVPMLTEYDARSLFTLKGDGACS